jgi:spermidine synthase
MGVFTNATAAPATWRLAVSDRTLFGTTIFLSSFLLFQVQPILAKQILPWFGGSAAVWTTSLLFFQTVLFLGYGYAHWLGRLAPPRQRLIHGCLLIASFALLPAIPALSWKPVGDEDPLPRIMGLLATTVGVPYFALSATTPLLQLWLTQRHNALPWRFYAISNAASLTALLAYPLVVEPLLSTRIQAMTWSGLYALFLGLCGWVLSRGATTAAERSGTAAPALALKLRWLILAAIPCVLSLSVTNHLCQNVAAVPFLWILPLAMYLLSLIVCFEGGGWYRRGIFLPLHAIAVGGAAWWLLDQSPAATLAAPVAFFSAALWVWCMYLHGELARRKPEPGQLTSFYMMMSLGGAIGAAATALGAPYLLRGSYELPVALVMCGFVTLMLEYRSAWWSDIVWTSVAVATLVSATAVRRSSETNALEATRNFYGGLRVVETADRRIMVHGAVSHGVQLKSDKAGRRPTAYYARGSGVAEAIERTRRPGHRVGVVGLGVGTLAAYAQPGDTYRFYELNPAVARMARRYFTFLSAPGAAVDVALGDGRLLLERESPQGFDLLAIDAFSGDSIPMHLLSQEAFAVYFRHLRPDGLLALHVSNTALALAPVAERVAASLGRDTRHIHASDDPHLARSESDWVLVSPAGGFPTEMPGQRRGAAAGRASLWTDDYSNLLEALK